MKLQLCIYVLNLLQLLLSNISSVAIFNVCYPFSCINFPFQV